MSSEIQQHGNRSIVCFGWLLAITKWKSQGYLLGLSWQNVEVGKHEKMRQFDAYPFSTLILRLDEVPQTQAKNKLLFHDMSGAAELKHYVHFSQ